MTFDRRHSYGIEPLKSALSSIGNPQQKLKTIVVGGTNGKGSTTNYIRSILNHHKMKVGTFTSPHLVDIYDRIRVDGVSISENDYKRLAEECQIIVDEYQLTIFEVYFLVGILYYLEQGVDYAILEVGVGGRLDAANVCSPLLCVLTHVGYDHMGLLGNTLEAIASDKSGIMRPGVPFYTTEKKMRHIFMAHQETPLHFVEIPSSIQKGFNTYFKFHELEITLFQEGIYQVENASLAATVAFDLGVPIPTIIKGIETTTWKGRFEYLEQGLFIDGAHNMDGIGKLIETLKSYPRPHSVVFSALRDKDTKEMMNVLCAAFDHVYVTTFEHDRAQTIEELSHGFEVETFEDYHEALRRLMMQDGTKVVTGSLYFISEIRKAII